MKCRKKRISPCGSQQCRRWLGREVGGSSRASGHFDTKQKAIDAGREISRNQGTEFFIHGKDGKIQRKYSHGNDPFSPKV